MTRIEREKKTVRWMIEIWCHDHHGTRKGLCPECSELLEYAHKRLELCKFGEQKKYCHYCPVHCYKPQMRERIREVMRYSGPRMLFHHPLAAIRYLLER